MEKYNNLVSPLVAEIEALNEEIDTQDEELQATYAVAEELGEMLAEAYTRIDELQLGLIAPAEPAQQVIPITATIDSIIGKSLKEMDKDHTLNPGELGELLRLKAAWKATK